MARWIESWMPGSGDVSARQGPDGYPGERFGLPESGVGATVGLLRRAAALTVDWFLAYLLAVAFGGTAPIGTTGFSFTVLGVWYLLTAVPVAVFGASAGMTLLGIRVASLGSAAVIGIPRALLRTLLTALVAPPLIRDRDGRGWHDRAARTIVVRTRA
jgi:uncharacterized RDD family membrane protein YckC